MRGEQRPVTDGLRTSNRRPLVALYGANAISIIGTTMTLLAIPWFVLSTTGSAARTGVAAFCEGAAFASSAAIGGLVVDRLGRRLTSIVSDLTSGTAVAAIAVLHATVGLPFWALLVLTSAASLARAPGETARSVLLPRLAERAAVSLERATSAADGVSRGARMGGAPLAGVLVAVLGPTNVLFVNAATFAGSALLVWLAVADPAQARRSRTGHPLADLREGLAFLLEQPLIRAITLMVMLTNMLDAASTTVLLPVYARDVLGSSVGLGLMFGVFGAGALSGAVLYGVIGHRLPRRTVFVVAFLIVGGPRYAVLAAEPGLLTLLIVMAIAGLAAGALNPILSAVDYERIPVRLQGRVLGVLTAGVYAAMPIGALGAGWLVEAVGLRTSLIGLGVVYLLVTLSPLVFPIWRTMDASRGTFQREEPAAPSMTSPVTS